MPDFMRRRSVWATALATVAGAAVSGACVTPTPADEDPRFSPAILYASGTFAFNPVSQRATPYTRDGERVPLTLHLTVLDQRFFDTGLESFRCDLEVTWDGPRRSAGFAAVAGDTARFGFTFPAGAPATGGCPEHDPTLWETNLEEQLTRGPWGLAVGPLDPDVASRSSADVAAAGGSWPQDWAPVAVGGGFYWDALTALSPSGFVSNDLAVAYALDDADALLLDADGAAIPLANTETLTGSLPHAAYVLDLVYGVDAGLVRDLTP